MNSPVPFLTNSQAETRQQTNLWQHQMQQHPPPPLQQQQSKNPSLSLQQQNNSNLLPRRSVGPMPQSRADMPRAANNNTSLSHAKINSIPTANRGLNVSTIFGFF